MDARGRELQRALATDPQDPGLRVAWIKHGLRTIPIGDPWHDLLDECAALGSVPAREALGTARTIGWDLGDQGQWWCTIARMSPEHWLRWTRAALGTLLCPFQGAPAGPRALERLDQAWARTQDEDSRWDQFQRWARELITRAPGEASWPMGWRGAVDLAVKCFEPDLFGTKENE